MQPTTKGMEWTWVPVLSLYYDLGFPCFCCIIRSYEFSLTMSILYVPARIQEVSKFEDGQLGMECELGSQMNLHDGEYGGIDGQ
jgi:hypothetical protein